MKALYFFVALLVSVLTEGRPDSISSDSSTPTTSRGETKDETEGPENLAKMRCDEMIGKYVNGTFVGLEVKYDLLKILEKHGGFPGKVNATWIETEDAPVTDEEAKTRPLPYASPKYWIYNYGHTDYDTYLRNEHAIRRFRGTPEEFLEIRGEIYFTPEDFCGYMRAATYIEDDRGFMFEVSRKYCMISTSKTRMGCAWPARCTADGDCSGWVATTPSPALLAALIGGAGK